MSGVGTKDTTKFKQTSGNNGKQVNNQNQNEPKKNFQGKRDSKSGADGRSGSQRNENVWTARAVLNAKQDPKTENQNTTEELTQKIASDLNLKDEKGEQQQNHDQRQNRKPSKYSSNMNQKGYKNTKRGNNHQEDSSKNQPVTQYVQKQPTPSEELKVVEPEEQIDETIDPDDRSDSPNNTGLKGAKVKKLSLAEFHSTIGGEDDPENEIPSRILWVGNIGPDVSEEELTQEFSQFGKLESLRILHDRFCAFVNFEEESCAQKAKSVLQGTIIGSQYIVINYRKVDSLRPSPGSTTPDNAPLVLNVPSRALWIGNISDKVSEEDLFREFSKFGQIESVRLLTHKTCAFVNFLAVEDATKALYALQSKDIGGMPIKINFGKPPKRVNEMYSPFMMPPPGPYLPQPFYPPEYQYPMHYPPFQAPMPPFVPMEMNPQYQAMYIPPNPMCDLCGANLKDMISTPCGHSYCCNECINKYRTSAPEKVSKCPYCGTDIEKFVPFPPYPYSPYYPQMMPEFPQ